MSSSDIRFDILARDRASGVFDKVGKSAGKMGLAAAAAAGAAVTGLALFAKSAVEGASDTNESMSKVNVVFGKSADVVKKFAATSASSLGLSQQAALEAAGSLGNLFVALKLPQAQAAGMSTKMVGLAGDLASFNNVPVGDALEAIRSGLVGETEPMRKFGVNMNDATLHTQALKMGLISNVKDALTPSVKAQAAYGLILAQTGTAQGDFARTSSGLANQQRILGAKFTDLKAKIGAQLLPVVVRLANFASGVLLPGLERLGGFLQAKLGPVFSTIRGGMLAMAAAFRGGGVTSDGFAGKMELLGIGVRKLADWFMSVGLPALRNFGGYIRDSVIPVVQRIAGNVIPAAVGAFNHVRDAIQANKPQLQDIWAKFKQVADFVITKLVPVLGPILAGTLKGMGWLIGNTITTIGRMVTITKLWWTITGPILKLVAGAFLAMAGQVIHSAAVAFGWIPGIGPKLRAADKEFRKFSDSVSNSIKNAGHDKTITVTAYGRVSLGGGRYTNVPINAATGGYISGPGGPRSDQIPARLSNGEFVVNAAATSRTRPLLEQINRGYADGGVVARTSSGLGSWPAKYEAAIGAMMTRTAQRLLNSSTVAAGSYGGGGSGGYRDLGRRIATAMGYGAQFGAIDYIATRESGWNPRAQNPTSSAYGIFQFLNGTWAGYGGKTSDPSRQISAGIRYMRDRYGSPNAAADFWRAHHWYGNGGVVGGSGPQAAVVHGGERVLTRAQRQAYEAAPVVININVTGSLDGDATARKIEQVLRGLKNRNGRLAFQ